MTFILGIDPGSRMTGIGIIQKKGSKLNFICCDTLKTPDLEMHTKLRFIFDRISTYMDKYNPEEVAIESVFMHKNPQSAIKLGQARGAAMVAASRAGTQLFEYSPRQIKQATVGYGGAQKDQVQHMVRQLLNLAKVPQSDAADALAVAVCHANSNTGLMALIKAAKDNTPKRRVK